MGLAIATSGAAASPNMGYHTSPTLAFLMTVFNVRLGWWLRNPRFPKVWTDREHQRVAARAALRAARHDDRRQEVGVPLGWRPLREPRRLRAGAPPLPADHRLRRRPGRRRHLRGSRQRHRAVPRRLRRGHRDRSGQAAPGSPTGAREWHCAIGTIRYDRLPPRQAGRSAEVPGTLLYIKSSLTGDEPADILRYAAEHPAFPHESTSDQFFDESQFESYRALGFTPSEDVFSARPARRECGALARRSRSSRCCGSGGASRRRRRPMRCGSTPAALDRIWTMLRHVETLNFLDGQMFPEMPALMGLPHGGAAASVPRASAPLPDVNYWLPTTERRAPRRLLRLRRRCCS